MIKKLTLAALFIAAAASAVAQQLLPYQNPSLTPEQRAEDLIPRLTIEEKAKLMLDVSEAIPRLGIPQFQWWSEALHGIGRNGFTTVFPITMGMASSWDDALLYKCFDAASDEARIKNQQAKRSGQINRYQCLSFWTPNINIFRDPRWGRGQETYGEDPYLTTRMGLAVVNGLQGPKDSKYKKLLACAKHFAIHSGPEWNRHSFNIENLPERDLWETYLPAFKSLVQDGDVAEVMCAYQSWDGQPCCGNTRLLQQILRDDWGFKGIVVSDCGAIRDFFAKNCHEVVKTPSEAAGQAVSAGTDVNCGSVYKSIPEALEKGQITMDRIDKALKRLLIGRFELGDFDPDEMVSWTKIPENNLCSKEHNELAYKMAQESMVLLQNNNSILPLKKEGLNIAVIGPNACDSVMQWGNYSGFPTKTVTILQGIEKKVAGKGTVKYVSGSGHTSNDVTNSLFGQLTTPDGKQGMQATYWNNLTMEGEPVATMTHTSPIKLNNGGATVFAPGVSLYNFTGKYEATFHPVKTGKVTLAMEGDDGYRCIVNGDTVLNRYKGEHGVRERTYALNAKAGEEYKIQIDYKQTNDMAHFRFDINEKVTKTQEQMLAELSNADIVVFVGGISPRLEGEEMKVDAYGFKGGDRTDIQLPQCQRDLIKAIHDAGKKIVYVNCSGSAIALVPETENCEAILQAWYPGERGGDAVADVLFGDYNPAGKLPITIYRSVDDLPDFLDYTMKNRTYRYFNGNPLWAFGYGLSYTTFNIGKPSYKNGKVTVSVQNTGKRDGDEIVQVYIKKVGDNNGPAKTLRGFKRVSLKVGEKQTVTIDMPSKNFEWWDPTTNTMRTVSGRYEIMVGESSNDVNMRTISIKL